MVYTSEYKSLFKFQKGHNSYKNWCKLTTLYLDLKYRKTKSYAKFQLNISSCVREKCGKLYFQLYKFQKGHNSHKIDDALSWSLVQLNKVICKISALYVKAYVSRHDKTRLVEFYVIMRKTALKRGVFLRRFISLHVCSVSVDNFAFIYLSVFWLEKFYSI